MMRRPRTGARRCGLGIVFYDMSMEKYGATPQWARIGVIMVVCSWHDALAAGEVCVSALQRQQLRHHRAPGRLRRAGDQLRSQQDRA
jgi:hypothetical protein